MSTTKPSLQNAARHRSAAASARAYMKGMGLNLVLTAIAFTLFLPFCWMVLTSLKSLTEVSDPDWVPRTLAKVELFDVVDREGLIGLIVDENEPVGAAIRARANEETIAFLVEHDRGYETAVERSRRELAAVLDLVVLGEPIWGEQPWSGVELSESSAGYVARAEAALAQASDHDGRAEAARLAELANRAVLSDATGGLVAPPRQWKLPNYLEVFRTIPFGRYYWNSVFVASWVTFLQVFTSSMAAFSFSRIRWKGRDKVFLLYLSTMMLPGLVMMIPNYQIMIRLGLVDTLAGLIIPAAFTAFGTFLLRQFMLSIPASLDEAAEIDGASRWRLYWDIILPLARPGLVTLAIFTFMGNYHSFFWPLVMLRREHNYTLPIGLLNFDTSAGQETNLLMAAVTMSVVPMLIVFVVLQKQLVKGIQLGAVKG